MRRRKQDAELRRGGGGHAKVEDVHGTRTDVCSVTSLADRWWWLRPIPSDSVCPLLR